MGTEPGLVWDDLSQLFKAYGGIKITYKGGTVYGRSLTYNPVTHVAVLKGNVVLESRGQQYRADAISLDTNSRLWNLTNFSTTVQPKDIPNRQVVEPIFISGPSFSNTLTNEYHVSHGQVTSCNLPGDSAHYWVDAKEVTLIPGNRLIMRGASFVLLGHRLFTLPSVTLSLNERTQRNQILPEFGHNQYEGYYVKEKYPLAIAGTSALLLLDLMSKKGVGKGIDDAYRFLNGTGRIHIYQIKEKDTGTNDLSASIEDTRRVGDWNLRLNSNYSKNDYTQAATTGSSQTSQNSTFGIDRANAFSSTSANISLSTTDATASKSLSLTENLRQSFNLGKRFRIDGSFGRTLNSFMNESVGGATQQPAPAVGQDEYGLSFTETDPRVTAVLASDIHQPFGGSQFYFVERYPELTFTTSTARLFPTRRLTPGIRAGVTGSGIVATPSGVPVTTGVQGALTPAKGAPVAGSSVPGTKTPDGVAPATGTADSPVTGAAPTGAAPTATGTTPTGSESTGTGAGVAATPGTLTDAAGTGAAGTGTTGTGATGTAPTATGTVSTSSAGVLGTTGAATVASPLGIVRPRRSYLETNPLNFTLNLGHYREAPMNVRRNRLDFAVDATLPQPSSKALSLTGSGRFEQKMASDGSAQYVLNLNTALVRPLSAHSSFNLAYYRIQPVGYTPFQFDRPGNTDTASVGTDLSLGQQPKALTHVVYQGSLSGLSTIGTNFGSGYSTAGAYGATAGSYGGQYGGAYGSNGAYGGVGAVPYGGAYPGSPAYGSQAGTGGFIPAVHLGLHTAYDFNAARNPTFGIRKWSPLTIDMVSFPTRHITFYASTTYDLNGGSSSTTRLGGTRSPFTPVRGGVRLLGSEYHFVDTSFTYDPSLKQFTTIQSHILSRFTSLWTAEAVVGYQKGFGGGSFDPFAGTTEQVLLTRDLHCFQANLYYSNNPQQINFSISIKAFPILQHFGVQKFGQLFNQGFGHSY